MNCCCCLMSGARLEGRMHTCTFRTRRSWAYWRTENVLEEPCLQACCLRQMSCVWNVQQMLFGCLHHDLVLLGMVMDLCLTGMLCNIFLWSTCKKFLRRNMLTVYS